MKPFLSVVIPSYNEKKNLERGALNKVVDYLSQQKYSWELILSDDGSSDGTTDELDKFSRENNTHKITVLKNKHAGKGPTVTAGMLKAKGDWRLFTDFDQSTPISEIEKLLQYSQTHDIVFGSREMIGAKRDKEPLHRHIMGWGFNTLVRALAVPGILDTQCGFKMFSEKATQDLFPLLYVYGGKQKRKDAFTGAFDVELLYLAQKFDFRLREVPIYWKHYHSDRVSPIKDSLRMLRDIILIRIADYQQKYTILEKS